MKVKHGEVIDLHWDCESMDTPCYIKGHVDYEQVLRTLNLINFSVEHKYGRLFSVGLDHEESFDGITSIFRTVKDKRPSYYPVTEVINKEKE